ncbi:MAG: M6 family metalloprotease domain-containing protein, partial [candidate division Zixibacteria bacterium]|nr:M6 family metalloprotease domain-containing protein [candidate division Zixibacteria bacterium]
MPLTEEVIEKLKADGTLEDVVAQYDNAKSRGLDKPNVNPFRFNPDIQDVDTIRGIIILVDFDDMPKEDVYDSEPDEFIELLFSLGEHPTGSMRDYYWENSYQQAVVIGEVAGWYRMPQLYSYYVDGQRGFGYYPRNAQKLAEDAVVAADPDVNFNDYDNDNDGMVDALFIVHAGPGYEDTGNPNYIHSHVWVMGQYMELDDVHAYVYSMEPEETGQGRLVNMGVFGHEFGHVLGLPDLYDTDYTSTGLGAWSMMAGGSWGNGGVTPSQFDAWCKYDLGWINPHTLEENVINAEIPAVESNPEIYRLWYHGDGGPQYFLVENRRRMLFDAYLPAEGLLIYHVDERVPDNRNEQHYRVACEQADGRFNLENGSGADAGDPWPGNTDNRTFDDFSIPNAWDYDEYPTEVAVWNIGDSDSIMTASFAVMYDLPLINMVSYYFDDASGNNNGRPEGGETVNFYLTLSNERSDAVDADLTVTADTSAVVFSDNISHWDEIPAFSNRDNNDDPITFSLPDGYETNRITLFLNFTSNNGDYSKEFEVSFISGIPEIVIIDDDRGDLIEEYYTSTFDNLGITYDVWDISSQGRIGDEILDYRIAVWFTGDHITEPVLSSDAVEDITNFLDSGQHSLFLTSQDAVQSLTERGDPGDVNLLQNFLRVSYGGRGTELLIEGEDGDPIGDEMQLVIAGNGGAANQLSPDYFNINDTDVCFKYTPEQVAGTYHNLNNGSKVALFGFGFEAINGEVSGYNSREEVMGRLLTYLFEPTDVAEDDLSSNLPGGYILKQNYPNPFNAKTSISFTIAENGDVSLAVFNLLGEEIKKLHSGYLKSGEQMILWDGTDNSGETVSSGIYFYRLSGVGFKTCKRMTLLK